MTNAPLDTQPALRPRSPLVRGGRLTRFKGRVASIAPGLSVVAATAMLFTGSVNQAAAQAADACGPEGSGQDTVICGAGEYSNGITYAESDGLTLILNEEDITVRGSGAHVVGSMSGAGDISVQLQNGKVIADGSIGLFAQINNTASTATARVRMTGGEINTTGAGHHGILADSKGLGDAIAQMEGGKITTSGVGSRGLWANVDHAQSTASATASMTGGEINLGGDTDGTIFREIAAIYASNRGLGAATASLQDARVITAAADGRGLWARISNTDNEATATADVINGDVLTTNEYAYGLYANSRGLGGALASIERSTVTTLGYDAEGVWSEVLRRDNPLQNTGTSEVRVIDGHVATRGELSNAVFASGNGSGDSIARAVGNTTITTYGWHSYGLSASAYGAGKAIVELGAGAVVTVYGEDAHGLHAEGGAGFDVYVAGSVTGGAGNGAAIRTLFIGSPEGTIDIASTGEVMAGTSGIAIQGDGAGAVDIFSAGTIKGDIRLGAGDDKLRLTGGSVTGDIHLGTGDDTLELKDGSFTGDVYSDEGNNTLSLEHGRFTGDIRFGAGNDTLTLTGGSFTGDLYAGDGDDTVTISAATEFDSSNILDGGAGDDRLTLHGQTLTTMENLRNWEHLTLTETELSLEGVGTLEAGLSIEAGSEFRVTGGGRGAPTGAPGAGRVASASGEGMTIRGDVINAGDVTLSVQDGVTGDVITIDGDYTNTGSGRSAFVLDTVLEGAGFATDRLEITGATSGEIGLSLAGLDSAGAEVTDLEVDLVSVGGASDGTFRLMEGNHVNSDGEHGVIAGAYLYRLAETAGGWALSARSEDGAPIWQPAAPIHESYGASLLAFNAPSALHARGSSRDFRSLAWGGQGAQTSGSPLWIRMGTEQLTSSEENSTTGAARDSSIWEMEVGADLVLSESGAGLFVGGLMLSYGTGSTDVSSDFGDGSIDTKGLGLGLSATWYDTRGFYVDGQASLASYTSDLSSDRLGSLTEGNSGTGYALSLEAGQRLDLGARLAVIPQAQLSVSSVGFEDFTSESVGEERVSLDEAMSQQLRLGLEFEPQDQGASGLYGIVNLYHEFGAGSTVDVAGVSVTSEEDPWAVAFGLGGRYALSERVDLFGEASYATGLSTIGDTSALSASAGLKVVF